ncbi:MAG: ATP-binding protein [Bacteroidales bacterium]|nr:ATP-binding protein [Bacteroidales bacterium]
MKRTLYQNLLAWKSDQRRKPLLLQGARQVGKTWLINEFGKNEYKNYVYLNFEQVPGLKSIFTQELSPEKIIENIGLFLGKKVVAEDTLICFDEIQVCPEALTSLKYFQEQTPAYHIIAAGSLLGVSLGKTSSFPVGKVNFLTLYPLSFSEYLEAIGEQLLAEKLLFLEPLPEILHEKLINHLKMYFFLGGMPEVVADYIQHKDINAARNIQHDILQAYQRDFSKYSDPSQAIKVTEIWNSVAFQLAKENKKFMYNDVKANARSTAYQQSIEWLRNAGLIHIVNQIRAAKLPISGYADHSKFKVYLLDTGLLGALLNLSSDIILQPNDLFSEYNGAFVENYACLELLKTIAQDLFYWSSQSEAEVDFVFQWNNEIYPLEVKSGASRNTKSLRSYADKFEPKLLLRASPRNFIQSDDFVNIPLYGLMGIKSLLKA